MKHYCNQHPNIPKLTFPPKSAWETPGLNGLTGLGGLSLVDGAPGITSAAGKQRGGGAPWIEKSLVASSSLLVFISNEVE